MLREIAEAFRENDFEAYQAARYPYIQDGEWWVIARENLSGVDFGAFSLGYVIFKECRLDGARNMHGLPVAIEGCSAKRLDLRGTHCVVEACDSDFTGLLYDDATTLASPENGEAGLSSFINCKLDPATKEHFRAQGVVFREYQSS